MCGERNLRKHSARIDAYCEGLAELFLTDGGALNLSNRGTTKPLYLICAAQHFSVYTKAATIVVTVHRAKPTCFLTISTMVEDPQVRRLSKIRSYSLRNWFVAYLSHGINHGVEFSIYI